MTLPNPELKPLKNQPRSPRDSLPGLSSIAASAGESVSALNAEIRVEIAMVTAN